MKTSKKQDLKIKRFKDIVSKLKSIVDPTLCLVESWFDSSITLTVNHFAVVIVPHSSQRSVATNKIVKIVYDENYELLEKIVNNKKIKKDYNNASVVLMKLIKALRPQNSSEALESVEEVYDYPIKQALIQKYNLSVNPLKEYFLFGDDEIGERYRGYQKSLIVPEIEGIKVKIKDSSALLLTNKQGEKVIDLVSDRLYQDEQYIYLDRSILQMKPCSPSQSTVVSFDQKGRQKHFKMVLKKGVDLSKVDKISYQSANNLEGILKKDQAGTYFIESRDGQQIAIRHPDLMVYVLE